MSSIFNNEGKSKKRRSIKPIEFQNDLISNLDEYNKNKGKVSKSNCDLVHITLQKKLYQGDDISNDDQIKKQTLFSFKTKGILKHSKFKKESPDLFKSNTDREINIKFKSEIFKNKKNTNFSHNFEVKTNFYNELFQKFKIKIKEIDEQLNIMSKSLDINSSGSLKNKSMKFISFNEVIIFERKVVEFMEKQIVHFMRIVNNLELIYSNDDLNLQLLNDFYFEKIIEREREKEGEGEKEMNINSNRYELNDNSNSKNRNFNTIEKYNNISITESKDNLNTGTIKSEHCNTERKLDKKLILQRLFLPNIKIKNRNNNINSINNLNSETFRNSKTTKNSISISQGHKQFDLFKPRRNAGMKNLKALDPLCYIKMAHNMYDKSIQINTEQNNEKEKNENNNIKLIESKDNSINNNDNNDSINNDKSSNTDESKSDIDKNNERKMKNTMKDFNKEKIKNIFNINNINSEKENYKKRRLSVAELTIPNYSDIQNVNDYILNYKSRNKKKNENKEKNDDKNNHHNNTSRKKRKFKLKISKDIIEEIKLKINNREKGKEKDKEKEKEKEKEIEIEKEKEKDKEKEIEKVKDKEKENNNKNKINNKIEDTKEVEDEKDFNSEENSSVEEKSIILNKKEKNKNKKNEDKKSSESSMSNKDPLDDIKILQHLRDDYDKEFKRRFDSFVLEDEKDDKKNAKKESKKFHSRKSI